MAPKIKLEKTRHVNHAETAASVRKYRRAAKVSLTDVARETGISLSLACFLEKGVRSWTPEFHATYIAAIDKLKG